MSQAKRIRNHLKPNELEYMMLNIVVSTVAADSLGPIKLIWNTFKVWDEITYPFPNVNGVTGATVEIWEWIRNFIPHFIGQVITYPCWVLKLIHVRKGVPGIVRIFVICRQSGNLYGARIYGNDTWRVKFRDL